MITYLAVALGGAIGATLRYTLVKAIHAVWPTFFPIGILLCNVLGSFLIAVIATLLMEKQLAPFWSPFLIVGILGGFTTFSSFSWDTFAIFMSGNFGAGMLNILLNLGLCLMGCLVGVLLVRGLNP